MEDVRRVNNVWLKFIRPIADSRLAPFAVLFVLVVPGVLLVGCGVKLGVRVPLESGSQSQKSREETERHDQQGG